MWTWLFSFLIFSSYGKLYWSQDISWLMDWGILNFSSVYSVVCVLNIFSTVYGWLNGLMWHCVTAFSHTFTIFWSRKASVIAKTSQVSVCLCAFNRISHHFSDVFSLSFYLLSYPYFGTFLYSIRLIID